MKGVPVRVEVGPRDMDGETLYCARRDTGEKQSYNIDSAANDLIQLLYEIQENMYNQALEFREKNTYFAENYNEFKSLIDSGGFVRCGWDGDPASEAAIKTDTSATIRCILTDKNVVGKKCVYSGNHAKYEVIFARAY